MGKPQIVPCTEWRWQGHAAHLCVARDCQFHLVTVVGDVLISTIGDYFYKGERETIASGDDTWYETMVFRANLSNPLDCGCIGPDTASALETERYATAEAAREGHMTLCNVAARGRYSAAQSEEASP